MEDHERVDIPVEVGGVAGGYTVGGRCNTRESRWNPLIGVDLGRLDEDRCRHRGIR